MSSLLKFYVNTEKKVFKLRIVLYQQGVSSILKPETTLSSSNTSSEPTIGLYIDSDQEPEAKAIMKSFDKQLA